MENRAIFRQNYVVSYYLLCKYVYAYFNYLNIIPCVRDSHVKLHESFEIVPSRRAKLYLSHSRDIIHINQSYLFLISIFYDSFKLCWEICPRMIELKTDDTKYPKVSYIIIRYSWFPFSQIEQRLSQDYKKNKRRKKKKFKRLVKFYARVRIAFSYLLVNTQRCRERNVSSARDSKKNWTISSGMANDGKRSPQGFRNDSNHWSKQQNFSKNKCTTLVHFQFRIIQREKEKKQVEILERCSFLSPSLEIVRNECFEFTVPELSSFYPSPLLSPLFSWKFANRPWNIWRVHSSEKQQVVGIRNYILYF